MANNDVNAVLRSQDFFRIFEVVQSSGTTWELNESTRSIYIGPNSDLAEVNVQYFDPNVSGSVDEAVVSVNGPFVGRLDSLPLTKISSTGQPARIVVSPVDYIDNTYQDPGSNALRFFNVAARLDLIAGVQPIPDVPSVRADRTLRLSAVPYDDDTDGSTDLVIPIYGRRMITIAIAGEQANVNVSLVTLVPGGTSVPRFIGSFSIGGSIPSSIFTNTFVYRASDAARHSEIYAPDGTTLANLAHESDGATLTDDPRPRGMADLLLLNFGNALMASSTRFLDIFVKLCDRET